jgi:hypothetical protein
MCDLTIKTMGMFGGMNCSVKKIHPLNFSALFRKNAKKQKEFSLFTEFSGVSGESSICFKKTLAGLILMFVGLNEALVGLNGNFVGLNEVFVGLNETLVGLILMFVGYKLIRISPARFSLSPARLRISPASASPHYQKHL